MNWKSRKGKSKLIQEVVEKGFSFRRAGKGVNAVFACMAQAVARGEVVPIPGGQLSSMMKNDRPRREVKLLRNIQTGKNESRIMAYPGRRRVVRFISDASLDLTPTPVPTAEELEERRLAAELLRRTVDDNDMAELQAGVDRHPHKPGALLRRLREAKRRGWYTDSPAELAQRLAELYWL